ncbi:hypothetical protein MTR_4g019020 [Medicago truncatula]|uniref:Non-specific serine/threonine protein kinase n=1 Tax=Medicago truncatula TaxID=3880 RepID=G7JR93_MEDTR|nr:hypothetical protein MTR_4g019020 [Medicago truncatula]
MFVEEPSSLSALEAAPTSDPTLTSWLKFFTAIDFSSNYFEGPIPEVLMKFKAVHVLNFSNNAFSGEIPSTIASLEQIESLDLSNNSLVGEIPVQLASMSFLSYLKHLRLKCGVGICFWVRNHHWSPLVWKKWRVSYWKLVDKILCLIFRRMHFEYVIDRGKTYKILRVYPTLSIIRYEKRSSLRGLFFPIQNSLQLSFYSDVDWAGCPDTRRSVTGWWMFFWLFIDLYCVMYAACSEIIWLRGLLAELGFPQIESISLYADNTSVIDQSHQFERGVNKKSSLLYLLVCF